MLTYIIVSILFIPFLVLNKKLSGSYFLSPLLILQSQFAMSSIYVISLYNASFIPEFEFQLIIGMFSIFYVFFLICLALSIKPWRNFIETCVVTKANFQLSRFVFCVALVISIVYSYMLLDYASGNQRLVLNKSFRILSMSQQLFLLWGIFAVSLVFVKTHSREFLTYVFILVGISFFSGSKGAALSLGLTFFFLYSSLNKLHRSKVILFYFAGVILLLGPSFIMYDENIIGLLVNRILLSGDIYSLAFVQGEYSMLKGDYSALTYILHPFSSIIGYKGYDFPIGAAILETAGLAVTGTGPNPHFPIISLVLFDSGYSMLLFCLLYLVFFFSIFILAMASLKKRFHSVLVGFIFTSVLTGMFGLFFDIGMLSFKLVIICGGILFYFFAVFLRVSVRSVGS